MCLELNGRPVPIASQPMVHRLVRAAVEKVYTDGELQYNAGLREMPGFILTLREAFAEFKRALVYPEMLVERATRGISSPGQPGAAGTGKDLSCLSEPTARHRMG
jgi:hypothetical protein